MEVCIPKNITHYTNRSSTHTHLKSPTSLGYALAVDNFNPTANSLKIIKRRLQTALSIQLLNNDIIYLDREYSFLYTSILESKKILSYENDWDGDGAIAYSANVWKTSVQFVIDYAKWAKKNFNSNLYPPKIYAGPNGSIDLVWENKDFRLFINIDENCELGTFYSDTPEKQMSEGQFYISTVDYKLLPLAFKI